MGLPEDYDSQPVFIRHVVIPNAKRPPSQPGHPLYMNFYKEDVLHHLRNYQTILQFVFAHYATLERYYKSKVGDKMNPENFPRAWGPGNGTLRMDRSEFVAFCENFGIVGSCSRAHGVTKTVEFTRNTANWVFTSAKNGLEGASMCEECLYAQLPCCEHMTFREFVEAILRCAIILFPFQGMQMGDLDAAPTTNFNMIGMFCAEHALRMCTSPSTLNQPPTIGTSQLHLLARRLNAVLTLILRAPDFAQQGRLKKLMTPKNQSCTPDRSALMQCLVEWSCCS